MTAIATVRGGSARVCAYLFSAALRNAAMQTAEANGPVQRKHAAIVVRAALAIHVATPWRAAIG
ncbi:hypothetical protein [Xanthomonas euvesicatoria]|uniref:hypothetical protein n=1 Tax=Xanthomonas euvesicatoria TaxID=456327 RepID=UPI001E36DE04|nr:hypothetical protein [Xanthomonas euvesicatoria]